MSLAILYSRAQAGMQAPLVTVETHLSNGLPALNIVGLPEAAVKESKDRVRSALLNSHFEFPARRITINLAPADLPKQGGRFDLPIALGILAASGQLPSEQLVDYEFAGELALSGELRSIQGALPFALAASQAGRQLVISAANAEEAALTKKIDILPVNHFLDVCAHLAGKTKLTTFSKANQNKATKKQLELADIRGQFHARRALEIAAAGGHSLLMSGPPGTGKTMLASRLPSLLPELSDEQALEVAAIHSISEGQFNVKNWKHRPFRAPHHTASAVALVGGGRLPQPGEISLAQHGVLFLDELPEFDKRVLESLREPLESGTVVISRANRRVEYPAKFQLVAAMNPCPCGYAGSSHHECSCRPEQINRYRQRVSGPLLDRVDLHIEVPYLPPKVLIDKQEEIMETSQQVRQRVEQCQQKQYARQQKVNCSLTVREVNEYCDLTSQGQNLLEKAMDKLALSARSYHRILRVARTIADLAEEEQISPGHLSEALSYRRMDRNHNVST